MPDRRRHRGPHPEDGRLFAPERYPALRKAVAELSWLLSRGYSPDSAVKLVGDHHGLTARQRLAIRRSACSDDDLSGRWNKHIAVGALAGRRIAIDGYNLLITVESALSGGVVLVGRDGCFRDLASIHGTYRKVEETVPALELITGAIRSLPVGGMDWFLDRPVSNSRRLRAVMEQVFARRLGETDLEPSAEEGAAARPRWSIELVPNPDAALAAHPDVVVTSDSIVLDRCRSWTNLAETIIRRHVASAWMVDFR